MSKRLTRGQITALPHPERAQAALRQAAAPREPSVPLAVAVTVSGDRPMYLDRVLASWRKARGSQEIPFVFCVEPGARLPECRALLDKWPGPHEVVVNATRLGCFGNTRAAAEAALERAPYALMAEEDVAVSSDILEYFGFASSYTSEAAAVACAHATDALGSAAQLYRAPYFSPFGWGLHREAWDLFRDPWKAAAASAAGGYLDADGLGWDDLVLRLLRESGRDALLPCLSRTRHVGIRGGQAARQRAVRYVQQLDAALLDLALGCEGWRTGYGPQDYEEITEPAGAAEACASARERVLILPGRPGCQDQARARGFQGMIGVADGDGGQVIDLTRTVLIRADVLPGLWLLSFGPDGQPRAD